MHRMSAHRFSNSGARVLGSCAIALFCAGSPAIAGTKVVLDVDHPTLVTLHLHNAPPQAAIDALAPQSQTVWPLYFDRGPIPRGSVTLDMIAQPYLAAYVSVCGQLKVAPTEPLYDHGVCLSSWPGGRLPDTPGAADASWMTARSVSVGPFLFVARAILATNSVDTARPDSGNRSMGVELMVVPEPKIDMVVAAGMFVVDEAADELGNSLVEPSPDNKKPFMHGNATGGYLSPMVNLRRPPHMGKRMVKLSGTFQTHVVSAYENVEIGQIGPESRDVKATASGMSCTVSASSGGTAGGYFNTLTIARPPEVTPEAWGKRKIMIRQSRFAVLDSEGRVLPRLRSTKFKDNGETVELEVVSSGNQRAADGHKIVGAPDKLVWHLPLEIKELVLRAEFKDLPLPG